MNIVQNKVLDLAWKTGIFFFRMQTLLLEEKVEIKSMNLFHIMIRVSFHWQPL